jgi:3-hydroxyacyl-[acyl-carrier-protein] dehydratase
MDYTIRLNPEHIIYQAHFPENPITPGVCIIQIVKELSKELLKHELFLKKMNNVKFLNVINPLEDKEVIFSMSVLPETQDVYKIGVVVYTGTKQFAKLSLLFINR